VAASSHTVQPAAPLFDMDKIDQYVQIEPALVLIVLSLIAALIYKVFLRTISEERHISLRQNFRDLGLHLFLGGIFFLGYRAIGLSNLEGMAAERATVYLGLAALIEGAIIFVKVARIYIFLYMYLSHRKVAFPLLVVNLFSLLLSIGMAYWVAADIFNVRLAPLLATSAIFSVIMGLALQDTLGNLFSGIALQFDKPYEIGCWIEVQNGMQKWVGQVLEVHWRATVLTGLSDELITIPNRIMAQAQISNFTLKRHTILRSQIFRVPYGTPDYKVREALIAAATQVKNVRLDPKPIILATESADTGVSYKLVYAIQDYGTQWTTADQVIAAALKELKVAGIEIAPPRIRVEHHAGCKMQDPAAPVSNS
jgi:small-conductance mechanosensitive channel